jgi:hypothetical protein
MHRDRDFELEQELPWHAEALTQDLALDALLSAMAAGDPVVHAVARKALLCAARNDIETVRYRQAVLSDCLARPEVVKELYAVSVEAVERRAGHLRLGVFSRFPGGILYEGVSLMQFLLGMLRKLRRIVDAHASEFASDGFRGLCALIEKELDDEYFALVEGHLKELEFRHGVLMSAELGDGNVGTNYVLRRPPKHGPGWIARMLGQAPPAYTYHVDPRDEAGARALGELRERGINLVANVVAQSADHVLGFFQMLRTELAFYVGCLNLHERLGALGEPVCLPDPSAAGAGKRRFDGLYDVSLALTLGRKVVGNRVDADGKALIIVTGANQGGKSTFLRSVGQAQLMMQCGMFVAADRFAADLCTDLFTHYRREEDASMRQGKFDEELARMAAIADHLRPHAIVLFNESFASTNEREGSEVARQIVQALLDRSIGVVFVTHLHSFARGFFESAATDALFLRAERQEDGTRTFRLVEGEPLETSYGDDLYREVFADVDEAADAGSLPVPSVSG